MQPLLDAISQSLPMAFGIMASPSPMIAIMILLMTPRAKSNAVSFLFGWFSGLILVGLVVLFIPEIGREADNSSFNSGQIRIILGTVFLILSIFIARGIPGRGRHAPPPRWQGKLDAFGFPQSFAFGFFFAVPNVKNASMVAAGMATVSQFNLGMDLKLLILILFCLVASAGVLIPPAIYVLFTSKAEPLFSSLKKWLINNRALILFLILLIFGILWIYQGILILRKV